MNIIRRDFTSLSRPPIRIPVKFEGGGSQRDLVLLLYEIS